MVFECDVDRLTQEWNYGDDQLRFICHCFTFVLLADVLELERLVSDAIRIVVLLSKAQCGIELNTATEKRQKSCADNRRKPLEFEVRRTVMPKEVSPWKGVIPLGKGCKVKHRSELDGDAMFYMYPWMRLG
ncbi:hypothetical protein Tco_0698674 [Tanacetum coccineum]